MSALCQKKAIARATTTSPRSLLDDIGQLRRDLGRMKDDLCRARSEIVRLEQLLARDRAPLAQGLGLGDLRRKVSFYCHPDRGGDVALMQRLNALFDQLEE